MIEPDLESLTLSPQRPRFLSFVSTKNCDPLESSTPEVRDLWTFPSICPCSESSLAILIAWEYETIILRMFRKLDLPRGRDSWCWPEGARPLGTRNNLDSQPQSHAIETVLTEKYSEGIGQLRDHEQQLHIDPSIPPVSMQTYRRTPFHLRKQQLMSFCKICRAQPSSELTSQLAVIRTS